MMADSTLRGFKDECAKWHIGMTLNRTDMVGTLSTGAEILFRSADDPEKFRGPNLSGIWLDEASLMHKDAWPIVIAGLRQGGEMGWVSSTFTPKGKAHWTYQVFGTGQPHTEMFHAATNENPFINPLFEQVMRQQYDANFAEQELGGKFIDLEGTLFHPNYWPTYIDVGNAYKIGRRIIYSRDLPIVITVDAASTKKNESDHTAFVVSGLTDEGEIVILDVRCSKWELKEVIPALAELCRRWRPQAVGIESDNFQQSLVDECRFYRDIPEVKPLKTKGKNKRARATAAVIKGNNGRIFLPEAQKVWLDPFKVQLSSFTGLDERESDDMVDALAYTTEMTREFGTVDRAEDLIDPMIGGTRRMRV
jgi:predicted phage terminase large subunit-like protein